MQDAACGPWGPLIHPPPGSAPAPGDCHVWSVPISEAPGYRDLLDEAERDRAERFRVESARATFVASRAAQRLILGRYLGCPAGAVRIGRVCQHCGADHGRPYVDGARFDFSVSHTAGWLLIAVVADGKVGVDIEVITAARAADELARQVFGPAEQEQFALVPRDDRAGAFIRAWTRKEAAVKLTGHGLAASLRGLDVTGQIAVTSAQPAGWPTDPIYLHDLPATPGLAAALATTVPVRTVLHCGPVPSPQA
jgi:4'-phosphopantetheinyl transferase